MLENQANQTQNYSNDKAKLTLFVQQPGNCGQLLGKVILNTRQSLQPIKIYIQFKGMYRIWDSGRKAIYEITESNTNMSNLSQTLSDLQNQDTKRDEKDKNALTSAEKLEHEQFFLEGKQKIAQTDDTSSTRPNQEIAYPFVFQIPNRTPPSIESIWFASKRIEIKYYLLVSGYEHENQKPVIENRFEIKLRENSLEAPQSSTCCRIYEYRCFTRFFCRCLGLYHIEINASKLRPGHLQVEGRVFRSGQATMKIVNELEITLWAQLKNVKKIPISSRKMALSINQYQMLSGEVLLGYDEDLKTFESELITIRFWLQSKIIFNKDIWAFVKRQQSTDIVL